MVFLGGDEENEEEEEDKSHPFDFDGERDLEASLIIIKYSTQSDQWLSIRDSSPIHHVSASN